jgi:uncharacterized membrane protein
MLSSVSGMDRLGRSGFTVGMSPLLTTPRGAVLIAATIATGLVAGLFYAYSCSVMPGLARADDRTFVEAMQHINVAILNGWFAAAFGGAPLLIAIAAALHLPAGGRRALPWIALALLLYAVMLAITFAVNVPLNDQLAAASQGSSGATLAQVRQHFEARWVPWNVARAIFSTGAFGCLTCALAGTAGST